MKDITQRRRQVILSHGMMCPSNQQKPARNLHKTNFKKLNKSSIWYVFKLLAFGPKQLFISIVFLILLEPSNVI